MKDQKKRIKLIICQFIKACDNKKKKHQIFKVAARQACRSHCKAFLRHGLQTWCSEAMCFLLREGTQALRALDFGRHQLSYLCLIKQSPHFPKLALALYTSIHLANNYMFFSCDLAAKKRMLSGILK